MAAAGLSLEDTESQVLALLGAVCERQTSGLAKQNLHRIVLAWVMAMYVLLVGNEVLVGHMLDVIMMHGQLWTVSGYKEQSVIHELRSERVGCGSTAVSGKLGIPFLVENRERLGGGPVLEETGQVRPLVGRLMQ